MRTHVDEKYMLRFEKMYEIKPKHQEELKKRRRHVRDMRLNIGCLYIGKRQYIKS